MAREKVMRQPGLYLDECCLRSARLHRSAACVRRRLLRSAPLVAVIPVPQHPLMAAAPIMSPASMGRA